MDFNRRKRNLHYAKLKVGVKIDRNIYWSWTKKGNEKPGRSATGPVMIKRIDREN